jgi:outer membrane protein insertion porin family
LEHPLVKEAGLKWAVFTDAGNVFTQYWGENGNYALRADWGFGLRWFSPIGPLRFEWGFPLNRRPDMDDPSVNFNFSIGSPF